MPLQVLFITPEKLGASGKLQSTLDALHRRGELARVVIDEARTGRAVCARQPGVQPDGFGLGCGTDLQRLLGQGAGRWRRPALHLTALLPRSFATMFCRRTA